jgi:hypothetical protein
MKRAPIQFVLLACLVSLLRSCGGAVSKQENAGPLSLSIDRSNLPAATVDVPYNRNVELTASGGIAPYRYSCAISNGAGLAVSVSSADPIAGGISCLLRGTPVTPGAVILGFSVTDSTNASASVAPLSFNISTAPDPLASWHWRSPLSPGDGLNAVVYGNGTFAAMSEDGAILTSPDGVTWTSANPRIPAHLNGVTCGNGRFVAVGSGGTILTSPDGRAWTTRNRGIGADLNGVTYGNGRFVAVGGGGTILTSPDGMTWISRNPGTALDLSEVTYGNGSFVTVGDSPSTVNAEARDVSPCHPPAAMTGVLLTSLDGATWIPKKVERAHLHGMTVTMAQVWL